MTTKLIGLTGKAGSGKDEVAKILWAEEGFTRPIVTGKQIGRAHV